MAQDLTPPDPAPILELLSAYRKSKVLFAAISLGVFEALASEPKSVAVLATELSADSDALERLLGACVMLGLLDETPQGFANTPSASMYLTQSSPHRLLGYATYTDAVLWTMWDHLDDAVREGTHRWKQTYGWVGPIFSHFFKTDEARREFLMGMHGYGLISSPHVVNAVDLSRFRSFVDLGGATGHLAVAACRRWPQLNAIVYDLPQVIGLTQELVSQTDVADRVYVHGADFFTDPLVPGDVYALGRILHDWTEEKILWLLGRIFEGLPSGGAVLIAEKLLHDDKAGPEWAVLQSLNMLVCTEGKELTLGEYEALLTKVGFADVKGYRTPSPLDVVLAVKP